MKNLQENEALTETKEKEKSNNMKHLKYREIFNSEMSEGTEIYNSKGEIMPIMDGELWKQCFYKDDDVRKDLPQSWFVSNKTGNVVSTYHGHCEWLIKHSSKQGYEFYSYKLGDRTKTIFAHALVGLVFDAPRVGKAKKMLAADSVYAFGTKENPDNVQAHHVHAIKDNPELSNDADEIEFLTVRGHNLVHQIPDENASREEQIEFLRKLSAYGQEESPDKILIAYFVNGERKIMETNELAFTQKGIRQLIEMASAMQIDAQRESISQ